MVSALGSHSNCHGIITRACAEQKQSRRGQGQLGVIRAWGASGAGWIGVENQSEGKPAARAQVPACVPWSHQTSFSKT